MDQFPQRITLSRHNGQEQTFLIKRCDEKDLFDILKLQRRIDRDLSDPGLYALVDEEDILESLKQDFCLGVYLEDTTAIPAEAELVGRGPHLVAFTMMVTNRVSLRNYGSYVGYPAERQKNVVSMEITIVDAPCRGFGMQRLFVELREAAANEMGATEAMVTIGPNNKYSLDNLLYEGYEIIETRPLYGTVRHILRKDL